MTARQHAERWRIEWSQKQGQFHIETADIKRTAGPDWQIIGYQVGSYRDATIFAASWLRGNKAAKTRFAEVHSDYDLS